MSDMELARKQLTEAIQLIHDEQYAEACEHIQNAYNNTFRVYKRKKSENESNPITQEIRDGVLSDRWMTDMSHRALAEKYNINSGRVSEILDGWYNDKFEGPPPISTISPPPKPEEIN